MDAIAFHKKRVWSGAAAVKLQKITVPDRVFKPAAGSVIFGISMAPASSDMSNSVSSVLGNAALCALNTQLDVMSASFMGNEIVKTVSME